LLDFHLERPDLVMLVGRMGHHARDEIAGRLARRQLRFAHRLGHLYLVAHLLLFVLAPALDRIGRFRLVRVLHTVGSQLLFVLGLESSRCSP